MNSTIKNTETSHEIDFENAKSFLHDKPYDVMYQTKYSDSYGSTGFTANIDPPSFHALLSRDIWIEYSFYIAETQGPLVLGEITKPIQGMFEHAQNDIVPVAGTPVPINTIRVALRSGNIMNRITEQLHVNLNNYQYYYYPSSYHDVMNRLYVSNKQSEHEFSTSGGCFDDGNHGHRTSHVRYGTLVQNENVVPQLFGIASVSANANLRTHSDIYLIDGFSTNGDVTSNATRDLLCNMRATYPVRYPYYNEGFSKRFEIFSMNLRQAYNVSSDFFANNAVPGLQFRGNEFNEWKVTVRERMLCPLFKMYSTDRVQGVIPNISNIKIQSMFTNNILPNLFRSSTATPPFTLLWTNITTNDCKLFLKWYVLKTPLPQEITLNLPTFFTYQVPFTLSAAMNAIAASAKYVDTTLRIENVEFPAIPDLLLVYIKYHLTNYTHDTPDDYNLEIVNFYMNLNKESGKCLNITSTQLYHLWKSNLNYDTENIISFDEWYQYCFVICLKPEDYGIKINEEYNQPCRYSFFGTARNWWMNPTVANAAREVLGGAAGAGTTCQFVAHGIYFRNKARLQRGKCENYLQNM